MRKPLIAIGPAEMRCTFPVTLTARKNLLPMSCEDIRDAEFARRFAQLRKNRQAVHIRPQPSRVAITAAIVIPG